MASLRSNESALEVARQQNFNATEAVNQAQASYYEVNAEVSNLENQVKNTADARERMQLQLQQLNAHIEKNIAQYSSFENALLTAKAELLAVNNVFEASEQAIKVAKETLPALSQQFQSALTDLNANLSALQNAEQRLRLEQANIGHITRTTAETNDQLQGLRQGLSDLQITSDDVLQENQTQLSAAEAELSTLEKIATNALQKEHTLALDLKARRDLHTTKQRELSLLEAEIGSLVKIQLTMKNDNNEDTLNTWLKTRDLENNARIWQGISIKKGWETALEAALGARLNAVTTTNLNVKSRSPSALTLAVNTTSSANVEPNKDSLYSLIEKIDVGQQAVLQDWLAGAKFIEDGMDASISSQKLASGEYLVNRQGDIFTKYSVSYFGAQSLLHGVFERQAQLETLQTQLPALQQGLAEVHEQVSQLELSLQALRDEQLQRNQQVRIATQETHQLNLSLQQHKQMQLNALQRQKNLQHDYALAEEKINKLKAETAQKEQLISEISLNLVQLKSTAIAAEEAKKIAETSFNEARNQLQMMEHTHQEKSFNIKLNNNNINELNNKINKLLEENTSLKFRCNEVETTLAATKMETLKANLEIALNNKQQREQVLAAARNKHE